MIVIIILITYDLNLSVNEIMTRGDQKNNEIIPKNVRIYKHDPAGWRGVISLFRKVRGEGDLPFLVVG